MIIVDTVLIGNCASDIDSARVDCVVAKQNLEKIKNHWTWHCPEKKKINNTIDTCEDNLKKIIKKAENLNDAIIKANEMFIETENKAKNGSKKGVVEAIIGTIKSIVSSITLKNVASVALGVAVPQLAPVLLTNHLIAWIKNKNSKSAYKSVSTASVQDGISIVDFSSLTSGGR